MVASLAAVLWLDATEAYRFRLTYEANFYQMEKRLIMQKEHYKQLSRQVHLAREASHDLRHHMRTLRGLAQSGQCQRLESYLNEYEPHVRDHDITVWSDHPTADAVLGYYAVLARKWNVVYDVRLTIPPEFSFPDDELCILLSNLLENAMDAVAAQAQGPRRIYLCGNLVDGRLGIIADNTFHGELKQKNGMFLSTKHPSSGLGISSIMTIVEKYNGLADFGASEGIFRASIFIPISSGNH